MEGKVMKCPYCTRPDSKVLDSRLTEEGASVRRRRECLECGERFTTYERVDSTPLVVLKKDGRRELFNAVKLFNGLLRACEKTELTREHLEKLVKEIEREIRDKREREVTSLEIGARVMHRLKALDRVAYLRFASVCQEFKDVNKFKEELDRLLREE